jgi:hypothetical protein
MIKTYGIGALSGLLAVLVIQIMPPKWVQETAGILVGVGVSFGVSSLMELRCKLEELTALRLRLMDDEIKADLERWFG